MPADPAASGAKADAPGDGQSLANASLSWTCTDPQATGMNANRALVQLTHKGRTIVSETVEIYTVIKDGKQQDDRAIGQEVFNVKPSQLTALDEQELKLTLSLEDFSDERSYTVILQRNPDSDGGGTSAFAGVLLDTFQSSDGDDLLHPRARLLACTVTPAP
jgi:hypothetical protein